MRLDRLTIKSQGAQARGAAFGCLFLSRLLSSGIACEVMRAGSKRGAVPPTVFLILSLDRSGNRGYYVYALYFIKRKSVHALISTLLHFHVGISSR